MRLLSATATALFLFAIPGFNFAQKATDFYSLGIEKYQAKDYNGAIDEFTKIIETYKDTFIIAHSYFQRGFCKYHLEDFNGAIQDYSRVIEFDKDFTYIYYNMGCMYSILKDDSLALSYLEKSFQLQKDLIKLGDIDIDADLNNIRSIPAFKALLEKYFDPKEFAKFPGLFINSSNYWRRRR